MLSGMDDTAFDVSDTTPETPAEAGETPTVEVEAEAEADAAPSDDAAPPDDTAPTDDADLAPLAEPAEPEPAPPTAEELAVARAEAAEAALAAAIAGTEIANQAAAEAMAVAAAEAASVVAALKAELAAQVAAAAAEAAADAEVRRQLTAAVDAGHATIAARDAQLETKDVLIAQLREHLAAADGRYAALRADLAATTPWYVDVQPKGAGPRARKRLIVVAKDMQRATTKATGYAQGADVLAIAANTEQALLFDV